MSTEIKKEIALEIAHVLFIDIVGYSKLSINDQRAAIDELTQVVRASEQFQNAEAAARLIKIPTGDGMALVFYKSPEEPVKCALEISRALKEHPKLQLRMGAHSGPVSGVIDVNGQANLAGAGLNTAQRVMACGDAGHILLSRHVAEDLEGYEQWRPFLHDLGFLRSEARRQITDRKSVHGGRWQQRVASQTSGAKTRDCQEALDPTDSITGPARGRGCCFRGGFASRDEIKLGRIRKEHRRLTIRKPERR